MGYFVSLSKTKGYEIVYIHPTMLWFSNRL